MNGTYALVRGLLSSSILAVQPNNCSEPTYRLVGLTRDLFSSIRERTHREREAHSRIFVAGNYGTAWTITIANTRLIQVTSQHMVLCLLSATLCVQSSANEKKDMQTVQR